ncbi:MAG: hypothetical protein B1H03_07285 [Planctomycetales bacterium 4484_113]|nr:MAG: hypothetical protein B1H03_07285 [Planctomycetales bacterium 4484_113]
MLEFKQQLVEDLATLQETAAKLPPLSAESAADWEQLMLQTEDLEARLSHIFAYTQPHLRLYRLPESRAYG